MKCISCEVEINPKWHHAIDQNVCPFCGQSIMEELLKGLLTTLQDTMEKLQGYPDQLNDWLLSNHNFIKTDSPNLMNYVPKEVLKEMKKEVDNEEFEKKRSIIKVKTDRGEEEVVTEKIQSDSRTAGFFERAELIKRDGEDGGSGNMDSRDTTAVESSTDVELNPVKSKKQRTFKSAAERTEYLKGLKKKIETEGSSAIISEEGLAAMISPEDMTADPEDVAALQSVFSDGDIINSAIPAGGLDDEDAITNRVLKANLAAAKGSKKGNSNEADLKTLREMQDRVQVNQQRLASGKGGFSRA